MTTNQQNDAADKPARRRVLVVEDEYLVAMLVEEMLVSLGYDVAQVAPTLEAAMNAATNASFDVAILDINLNGNPSAPIAEVLMARSIPFIFATGYGPAGLDSRYAHIPTLQKPFYEEELKRLLEVVTTRA